MVLNTTINKVIEWVVFGQSLGVSSLHKGIASQIHKQKISVGCFWGQHFCKSLVSLIVCFPNP